MVKSITDEEIDELYRNMEAPLLALSVTENGLVS